MRQRMLTRASLGRPRSACETELCTGYWSIDLDVLLATAADDLPAFLGDVRDVLARVSSEDGLYDG